MGIVGAGKALIVTFAYLGKFVSPLDNNTNFRRTTTTVMLIPCCKTLDFYALHTVQDIFTGSFVSTCMIILQMGFAVWKLSHVSVSVCAVMCIMHHARKPAYITLQMHSSRASNDYTATSDD